MTAPAWQTPGDALYLAPGCHVRHIVDLIPYHEAWTDAASWPVPSGAHDLDSTITPGRPR